MSVVYQKDPSSGTWVANPPSPQKALGFAYAAIVTLLAACAIALVGRSATIRVARPAAAPVPDPTSINLKEIPHSLKGAMELYKTRGNKYSLGHNDCSTFLLDYLAGHGLRLSERQTTATLTDPSVAAKMHLRPMTELELRDTVKQSVVIIRYMGVHHEVVGHCAVRLMQNHETYFVHNTESQGLVTEKEAAFYSRFNRANLKDVHYYRFENGF